MWCCVSLLFDCQYRCNWLPGKTRLRNDLLCVEWDIKPYTLTHATGWSSKRLCVCVTDVTDWWCKVASMFRWSCPAVCQQCTCFQCSDRIVRDAVKVSQCRGLLWAKCCSATAAEITAAAGCDSEETQVGLCWPLQLNGTYTIKLFTYLPLSLPLLSPHAADTSVTVCLSAGFLVTDISGVGWCRAMKFCRVVDLGVHQVISPFGELWPRVSPHAKKWKNSANANRQPVPRSLPRCDKLTEEPVARWRPVLLTVCGNGDRHVGIYASRTTGVLVLALFFDVVNITFWI